MYNLLLEILTDNIFTASFIFIVFSVIYLSIQNDNSSKEYDESFQEPPGCGNLFNLFGLVSNIIKRSKSPPVNLLASVAYPRLLSKRHSSLFKVTLYPPGKREEAHARLQRGFDDSEIEELDEDTGLTSGLTVVIKFTSPDIEFDEGAIKKLEDKINTITSIGKPDDDCHPGNHKVRLSIADKATGHEYVSHIFEVKVVDFAFDHISRPILSKVTSGILGLAAVATYILTYLEQIDKTFGYTAGTATSIAAAFIFAQYQALFQQLKLTSNVITKQP